MRSVKCEIQKGMTHRIRGVTKAIVVCAVLLILGAPEAQGQGLMGRQLAGGVHLLVVPSDTNDQYYFNMDTISVRAFLRRIIDSAMAGSPSSGGGAYVADTTDSRLVNSQGTSYHALMYPRTDMMWVPMQLNWNVGTGSDSIRYQPYGQWHSLRFNTGVRVRGFRLVNFWGFPQTVVEYFHNDETRPMIGSDSATLSFHAAKVGGNYTISMWKHDTSTSTSPAITSGTNFGVVPVTNWLTNSMWNSSLTHSSLLYALIERRRWTQ